MNHHPCKIFALVLIALLPGCQNKKPGTVVTGQTVEPKTTVVVKEFVPSPDSSITTDQMQGWIASNPLLDSLAFIYSDSFKTQDPTLRLRYQEDFMIAQDKICVRAGLTGGYKEYRWIMDNVGNVKNSSLLQSINAKTL